MDHKEYEDIVGLDVGLTDHRGFWTAVTRGKEDSFSFQGLVADNDFINVSIRHYPRLRHPIAVNLGSYDETRFRTTWLMDVAQAEELVGYLQTAIEVAKLSGPPAGTA